MPTLTSLNSAPAQRLLTRVEGSLAVSLQRLSSGLRINSAADDAAGLSISQRLTAQVRGLNQGVRNANDAISVTQTADASLASMTSLLQRVRELAVQAANGSNSAGDRQSLDNEAAQLLLETQRIASQTQLNGVNLLDGSYLVRSTQVGANVGDVIALDMPDYSQALNAGDAYTYQSTAQTHGTQGDAQNQTLTFDVGGGPITIVGSSNGAGPVYRPYNRTYQTAQAINASGVPGVTATAMPNIVTLAALTGAGITPGVNDAFAGIPGLQPGDSMVFEIQINNVSINYATRNSNAGMSMSDVAGLINGLSYYIGISAQVVGGALQLTAAAGDQIQINAYTNLTVAAGNAPKSFSGTNIFGSQISQTVSPGQTGMSPVAYFQDAALSIASAHPIVIGGSGGSPAALVGNLQLVPVSVANLNLLTRQNALSTINSVDAILAKLDTNRGYLGAVQNRLAAAATSAAGASQNAAAARSRITDADYAVETANYSRAMILHQSFVALTAQANSEPRLVLSLLKGLG